MDQRAFLILNAILVVVVLLFFLRSRKREMPSPLNLKMKARLQESSVFGRDSERSINVIFQYNGHSWDAFEVLGIPAGSRKADAEAAADKLLRRANSDEKKFILAAIEAIRIS